MTESHDNGIAKYLQEQLDDLKLESEEALLMIKPKGKPSYNI
jgi:hypothetical protein